MSMYNTQQNEVEMVTAEGEDPNPIVAEGVGSLCAHSCRARCPHPCTPPLDSLVCPQHH